ncbi:unnamed protein product [Leptosia nina]|uniref:Uncharacterized protein n=1 Tax=Leptosia nina TaxID=320188 RepID=A0AAV1K408_9NEOP
MDTRPNLKIPRETAQSNYPSQIPHLRRGRKKYIATVHKWLLAGVICDIRLRHKGSRHANGVLRTDFRVKKGQVSPHRDKLVGKSRLHLARVTSAHVNPT